MHRPRLPHVTLCAIDTRCPTLALESLRLSSQRVLFARVVLFTHNWTAGDADIEVIDVGPIPSGAEYSQFVLRPLPRHIGTPYVLVSQWDGFVVDAGAWSDEFLDYDYIGAPWTDQPADRAVGNGGFSLRSRRLLDAGMDRRILQAHPEDVALCRTYRDLVERDHGVRFAPAAVAGRFAFENGSPNAPTFGFHGPKDLPRFLDRRTLQRWLPQLPDDFYRSRDARRLMRALLWRRMPELAGPVATRRTALGRRDLPTRVVTRLASTLQRLGGTQ